MGDVSEGERSWVVSEEPFWHLSDKINTLRLRAAYGESGRQPAAFSALRTFSTTPGPGGVITVTPGTAGNADLRPEHGKEIGARLRGRVCSIVSR